MTKIDIKESRRILAAATERPWHVDEAGDLCDRCGFEVATGFAESDMKAAAHAVNTLPLALDEIEANREAADTWLASRDAMQDTILAKDREIERLRELVGTAIEALGRLNQYDLAKELAAATAPEEDSK